MGKENIKERFLNDTKDHQLEVLLDNGVYRHLKFSRGNSSTYRFDLHTWPGYLCVSGDMGCCVFSRTQDMFCFFRNDELAINTRYWAEKVQATSKFGNGVEEYSEDVFKEQIKEDYDDYCENCTLDEEEKKELWNEIEENVLTADNEQQAFDQAMSFKHEDFEFHDFLESNLKKYTFHYQWQCYAIVWGIQQYDKLKKEVV